jgi:hypothetical protein
MNFKLKSPQSNNESLIIFYSKISYAKEPDSFLYESRGMCKWRSIGWNVACKDFIIAKSLGAELGDFITDTLKKNGCN